MGNCGKSFRLAGMMVVATVAAAVAADTPGVLSQLKGRLVMLNGTLTVPATDNRAGDPKYIALYFGAGWCGPCHKFTPELVSFYQEMKPKYPEFEVVFMSRDTSAVEMQQYMAEMHMPWPALRYDAVKFSTLNSLCGPGIPSLVLIDRRGQMLSSSFEGGNYLGPQKVLTDLRKRLEQSGPAAVFGVPSPSASAAAAASSASATEWDKFFKKKTP
jgi:thiol-disulfide isomerase/thioredoxin